MQEILVNLEPFIIVESSIHNQKKKLKYENFIIIFSRVFLKREYLDDDTINQHFHFKKDAHRNIVEKYYDVSKEEFKI